MIIEVNGRPLNLYQVLYYYTRDEIIDNNTTSYNIYYRLTDGRIITEEFASEADRTAKIQESLETASLGGLVQVDTYADLPAQGGPGSIYITKDTGQTYYWDRATNTYVKTGIAGRTGVYATHEDLASQIGGSVTLNKTDLQEIVKATVDYMDGSDVIGPHFIHGVIASSDTNTVTVKTVTDFVFENFIQVATLNDLPTISHALEEELYYVKDIEEFRVVDKTNNVWKRPYNTKFTGIEQDISGLQESKQDVFQFTTMPEATESTLGIIVQYTGTTNNNYTNGYFYKGISSSVNNETVYSWENIDVQEHQDLSNYLAKDNSTPFTPTGDYNPATKKYVDEKSIPYQPFPAGIDTSHTTQAMITSIKALNLPAGSTYLGGVTLTDMPFVGNAEVEIYVYPNNVIYLTLRSANVSPYIWECNSHTYRGWEPVGKAYTDSQRDSVLQDLTPFYDNTETYAVGDFVIYNGLLYECKTDIPVAENFDPAKWESQYVMDSIKQLREDLNSLPYYPTDENLTILESIMGEEIPVLRPDLSQEEVLDQLEEVIVDEDHPTA